MAHRINEQGTGSPKDLIFKLNSATDEEKRKLWEQCKKTNGYQEPKPLTAAIAPTTVTEISYDLSYSAPPTETATTNAGPLTQGAGKLPKAPRKNQIITDEDRQAAAAALKNQAKIPNHVGDALDGILCCFSAPKANHG